MFFFKYLGPKVFTHLDGNVKFYQRQWFKEQLGDGSYKRDFRFFIKNRMALTDKGKFALTGVRPEMEVMFTGIPNRVLIGGKLFEKGKWATVPIDFDSRNKSGQDQFVTLGFKFRSPFITNSDLAELRDGNSIFVMRRYGGMGDIIMQSMIFPEIRKKFPNSKIIYAIPKDFHPLFENCTDIDEVQDCLGNDSHFPRMLVSGRYDFVGDISTACAEYEVRTIKKKGFVDKERSDIWAEHIGLKLEKHETCIRLLPEEIERARDYIRPDGRPIIGFTPYSAGFDRSYPYVQEVIAGLKDRGMRPILIHHADMPFDCEKLVRIDLRLLGGIISLMSAMVSTDTGPMHYAGILGVPIVGIFGVTDSKVRLSYYNAKAIQGKCTKQEHPCWGGKSNLCRKGNTGIAECMFMEPEDILKKIEEVVDERDISNRAGKCRNESSYQAVN